MQQDVTPKCLQFHMMGVDKNSRAGLGPKFGSWTMGFEWPTTQSETLEYHFGQKISNFKLPEPEPSQKKVV